MMARFPRWFVLGISLAVLMAENAFVPVWAEVSTFNAVADTYCNEGAASTNYGSDTAMRVGNYPGGKLRRALVRFKLTSMPPTATVVKATLKLHVRNLFQDSDRIRVHRTMTSWTENGVTWANFPDFDPTLVGATSVTTSNVPIEIDVTKLVQLWVAKPTTNRGCVLQGTNLPNPRAVLLATREFGEAAKRPKLVVEYTP
ncbi:MAG: DNRLRE domain-containing protein [Candidatus Zipacnadales bacterium]